MRPEHVKGDADEAIDLKTLSPDDQLSFLACAAIDLLCNGFGMSRGEAAKAFAAQIDELHPYVALGTGTHH
jgi:hypothetical protein